MIINILKIILIFSFVLKLNAIEINEHTSNFDILSSSYVFLDTKGKLKKNELKENLFIRNNEEVLGFGFVENYALWIKFTLKNITNKPLLKVLEYDNPETEDILFYDDEKVFLDGMFHVSENRTSLNPNFIIELQPSEEKVFYIKAHCNISTLIAKLKLWNKDDFIKYSDEQKIYIFIFFSIIFTLLLYNFMLFIFTKDSVYLYYVLYLSGMIIFQSIYLGVAQLYILSNELSVIVTKATFIYISLMVVPIILFSREFLSLYQFKKIDIILKVYLILIPILSIISYDGLLVNLDIIIIFIPLGFVLVFAAFFAYINGQRQAIFYIAGWTFVIISLVLSVLKSLGIYDATQYFTYINEVAFVLEAFLFSIALAHRIKILSDEKSKSDEKLIQFQEDEQKRLLKLVDRKTMKLKEALSEKEVLYKELNHRVKNNIQMILSLVNLQISKTSLSATKEELEVTKSRIYSILHLYEILNINVSENKKHNTYSYLKGIAENIKYQENVNIQYNILYELNVDTLLYIGLIVNELVTNSLKYAFKNGGEIFIDLNEENSRVTLIIKDDGIGIKMKKGVSLGLEIVKTLVSKQLLGQINIKSNKGTEIIITWMDK